MITRSAYLGLGSNLGQRATQLAACVAALDDDRALQLRRVSPVYESAPLGPVREQGTFFNAVVALETALDPPALLARCLAIETRMGRVRSTPQGPRTIDIDLLLVDDIVGAWPGLELPHPRMTFRAFVLSPLLNLQPGIVDPRTLRRLAEALPALADQPIRRLGTLAHLAAAERAARDGAAPLEAPCA